MSGSRYPFYARKGSALIFNHKKYLPRLKMNFRESSEKDKEKLESTLESLGFAVQAHDDLPLTDILKKVEKAVSENHSKSDCFLIAILTHGGLQDGNEILYAYDQSYRLEELFDICCPGEPNTLINKPKLFIVQVSFSTHDIAREQSCP